MIKENFDNNGYDYVDLGLPSGTLWASCNVGADKPSDYGLYFQWGDTQGYTAEQVGTGEGKKEFALDWSDYKFGVYPNFTKYTTPGETLDLEDDAAHVNMGGSWHMPTPTQIQELLDNTTSTWTTQDGVNGRLFTSKSDNSKSIFIPAAGYAWDGSVQGSGIEADVWSSVLGTDLVDYGQGLYFSSGGAYLYSYGGRCCGFSVRGVIDKNDDNSKNKKSNMNENLNLIEILKDAPKGTKLWSPICGDCELSEIVNDEDISHPIICRTNLNSGDFGRESFSADGKFSTLYKNAECVLFPSKENRDWSTFKVSKEHKHFEPYQKVLVKKYCDDKYMWFPDYYCFYDISSNIHYILGTGWAEDKDLIPYEGNEDKVVE